MFYFVKNVRSFIKKQSASSFKKTEFVKKQSLSKKHSFFERIERTERIERIEEKANCKQLNKSNDYTTSHTIQER